MTPNKHINQFFHLTKLYFRLYLGIVISIFLFILFFQPFIADKFEFENTLLFLAGFGVIAMFFLLISQIVFQRLLVKCNDENCNNSMYIPVYYFFQIATTSIAFVFYIRYVGQINITFNTVVRVVFICLSLPISVFLNFRINSYQVRLKRLLHEQRSMQDKLKKFSESYSNKHIEIMSDNDSDNFRIQVSEIVYVKSADNYVEIGYHDEGMVKRKMVRNTLRNVEQQLAEFNNFIRTHRTSLVNIQYIDKLNKNFNTYWLSLDKTKETIPVSRQYLLPVKELL
ncbi:MAG: LytTR family transcriptional regulator DNA-binding domain-containing protein [Bacteroidales bacterium]|nr:LytTR family transcriptional regulator DNA-binding domain-containing protein [Bacteroidales bacterium]